MDKKVRLSLMGLSYTPMQDGAFALLLAAEGTDKRIPVIIGAAEAQAIAVVLENINPQRPMTHDLFATMAHGFGIELKEVFVYRFEDGIFSSEMTFSDGDRTITLDSRTSDAVAVAIRTGAPIYTTQQIVDETGIELIESSENNVSEEADIPEDNEEISIKSEIRGEQPGKYYEDMPAHILEEFYVDAMENDDYEEAAIIKRILDERKNNNQ